MATRIRSHAKINLGLAIGPVRADGYHALATIYQTLAIHDFVTVSAQPLPPGQSSLLEISCNDPRVPCDARNTCWKIIERALERLNLAARVAIQIEKQLPVQGGLGAGSANAAAALLGLEKELQVALPMEDKLAIAAETGSDVPLFLIGGAVFGTGRGEQVSPLPDLPPVDCVIAVPEIGVSTPQAFRDWDSRHSGDAAGNKLTGDEASDRLKQLGCAWTAALAGQQGFHANATGVFQTATEKDRAGNRLLELVRAGIENDFETVVFPQYPSLRGILETLQSGSQSEGSAIYAALSGSGSALFGLYGTPEDSRNAAKRLADRGIPAWTTQILGREQYWRDIATP